MKKGKRLLIPYAIFAFGGIVPKLIFPQLVNGAESIGDSVINALIFGDEYWFLYTLFLIFAIFPLIVKISEKNIWLTFIVTLILSITSGYFPDLFKISSVFYYLPFFFVGYMGKQFMIFDYKNKLREVSSVKQIILLLFGMIIICAMGFIRGRLSNTLLNITEGLIGIVICVGFSCIIPNIMKQFGKYSSYSLALYLLNGYWLVLSRTLAVQILGIQQPAFVIVINVIIDFYLSYVLIRFVLSKIPIVREAIGIQ